MAKRATKKDPSPEDLRRAEANALAHHVSPQAGKELIDGSDERKAKQKESGKVE